MPCYPRQVPIVPPIFVHGDDLHVFASRSEAESWLEDCEPEDRAFDSEGRLLRISGRKSWSAGNLVTRKYGGVTVTLAEDAPTHQEELRRLIADWLPADAHRHSATTLAELVREAVGRHSR